MRFPRVEFMHYMRDGCGEAEISLCNSGVAGILADDFDLGWDDIILLPDEAEYSLKVHQVIADRYKVPREKVYTTAGSTLISFMAMGAVFDTPGSAMIEKPTYSPLQDALRVFSNNIISTPRWLEDDWAIDLEELERNWDPSVRLIVLTNFNNPTGVRTPDGDIKAIAEIAARSNGYVLVDEVFREFDFDGEPGCAASVADNVITTASFTKTFGFGCQRFGWFIGPEELREKVFNINDMFVVGDHFPAAGIILKAIENIEMIRKRSRKIVYEGRAVFEKWLETRDDIECVMPEFGPIAFPCSKDELDMREVADIMMCEHKILIAPGIYFGYPPGIRIGYAIPPVDLEKGLDILGTVLDEKRKEG